MSPSNGQEPTQEATTPRVIRIPADIRLVDIGAKRSRGVFDERGLLEA
jgi:hypothetical protein